MRLSKIMLHPYSKHRFYIPCTFELRTYDALPTASIHHIEENDIEVTRQNDINEVHMPHGRTQRNDTPHRIQHKCAPNWPILTRANKTAK